MEIRCNIIRPTIIIIMCFFVIADCEMVEQECQLVLSQLEHQFEDIF